MRKITFLMLFVALCSFSNLNAQTTLTPGDVVIVSVNADGDDTFDFVPLVDLAAGTVIKFTENGLKQGGTEFRGSTEGTLTYTVPAGGKTAGTVISFAGTASGDWTKTGSYAISGSGDNLIVYQGDDVTPAFIYGIGWASAEPWITTGTPGATNSYKPNGLSGNQVVTLGNVDNYLYTGTTTGTKAEILAAIADPANWTESTTPQTYTAGNFTISTTNTSIFHREIVSANAWISNGQVNVKATAGEKVEIYNTIGQKVVSTTAKEGLNTLSCDAKGILIVKVANRISKVIL